jgi:hypothetical protein
MSASNRLLWATVILAGPVDIALTLPNWHHESNPVVLALGPWGMVAVKAVALAAMVLLWKRTSISENRVARACLCFLFALYAVVAVTNLWVLAR